MGRLNRTTWLPWIAGAPAGVLAVLTVTWLGMAAFDRHPFWPYQPLTLSEAAALRDFGEVARLLEEGQDPNASYPVRAGFLYSTPAVLNPIEAALAANHPDIVPILTSGGAVPPAPTDPAQGEPR